MLWTSHNDWSLIKWSLDNPSWILCFRRNFAVVERYCAVSRHYWSQIQVGPSFYLVAVQLIFRLRSLFENYFYTATVTKKNGIQQICTLNVNIHTIPIFQVLLPSPTPYQSCYYLGMPKETRYVVSGPVARRWSHQERRAGEWQRTSVS